MTVAVVVAVGFGVAVFTAVGLGVAVMTVVGVGSGAAVAVPMAEAVAIGSPLVVGAVVSVAVGVGVGAAVVVSVALAVVVALVLALVAGSCVVGSSFFGDATAYAMIPTMITPTTIPRIGGFFACGRIVAATRVPGDVMSSSRRGGRALKITGCGTTIAFGPKSPSSGGGGASASLALDASSAFAFSGFGGGSATVFGFGSSGTCDPRWTATRSSSAASSSSSSASPDAFASDVLNRCAMICGTAASPPALSFSIALGATRVTSGTGTCDGAGRGGRCDIPCCTCTKSRDESGAASSDDGGTSSSSDDDTGASSPEMGAASWGGFSKMGCVTMRLGLGFTPFSSMGAGSSAASLEIDRSSPISSTAPRSPHASSKRLSSSSMRSAMRFAVGRFSRGVRHSITRLLTVASIEGSITLGATHGDLCAATSSSTVLAANGGAPTMQ